LAAYLAALAARVAGEARMRVELVAGDGRAVAATDSAAASSFAPSAVGLTLHAGAFVVAVALAAPGAPAATGVSVHAPPRAVARLGAAAGWAPPAAAAAAELASRVRRAHAYYAARAAEGIEGGDSVSIWRAHAAALEDALLWAAGSRHLLSSKCAATGAVLARGAPGSAAAGAALLPAAVRAHRLPRGALAARATAAGAGVSAFHAHAAPAWAT
jgi:hypothetical protein